MHSIELQRVTAAVREAEMAVRVERDAARSARTHGRGTLLAGDWANRILAETQQEISERRHRAMDRIRMEREVLNNAAMRQYVASRLKREQLKRVTDEIAGQIDLEDGRRIQAVSDDRFLARRRWIDAGRGSGPVVG